jgi:cysteine desulfurase
MKEQPNDKPLIYMDNAASTRTDPMVVEAMLPYFTDIYAVASSQFSHTAGLNAREALDRAREGIAGKIHAQPEEIIFTSGATESNNMALKGLAWALKTDKNRILCSAVEHNTVLHTCQWLESQGFELKIIPVDSEGFVDLDFLRDNITDRTAFVSIQHGNQEVGTVQNIETIAGICEEKGVLFHSDAALTFTQLDIDVQKLPVSVVSFSAHKIHGPKGVGALYVRKGTSLRKWSHGGYNEFDLRPGTENVAGVVGFHKAVELAKPEHVARMRDLQSVLIRGLAEQIPDTQINGPTDIKRRVPNNVNMSFVGIEGESVVLRLDMHNVAVITGSACFSKSLEPSYVMKAMGFSHERSHGSIRFTLSRFTSEQEVSHVQQVCLETVESLRKISPL